MTVDNGEVSEVIHHEVDVLRWSLCEVDVTNSEIADDVYEQVHEALQQVLDSANGRAGRSTSSVARSVRCSFAVTW